MGTPSTVISTWDSMSGCINNVFACTTDLLGEKFLISSLGEGKSRGKYGRILGTPYTADGQDICQLLVDSGLAVYYDGGKKTKVWA